VLGRRDAPGADVKRQVEFFAGGGDADGEITGPPKLMLDLERGSALFPAGASDPEIGDTLHLYVDGLGGDEPVDLLLRTPTGEAVRVPEESKNADRRSWVVPLGPSRPRRLYSAEVTSDGTTVARKFRVVSPRHRGVRVEPTIASVGRKTAIILVGAKPRSRVPVDIYYDSGKLDAYLYATTLHIVTDSEGIGETALVPRPDEAGSYILQPRGSDRRRDPYADSQLVVKR